MKGKKEGNNEWKKRRKEGRIVERMEGKKITEGKTEEINE